MGGGAVLGQRAGDVAPPRGLLGPYGRAFVATCRTAIPPRVRALRLYRMQRARTEPASAG